MRNLQFWIETNVLLILKDAPFDKRDAQLVSTAGSCADCPKRTGHNKLLFGDDFGKQGDQCTDPRCYNAKLAAHVTKTVTAKPNLVQISTAYGAQKEGSHILPRNKYTAIRDDKPTKEEDAQRPEFKVCRFTTDAIITEGSDIGNGSAEAPAKLLASFLRKADESTLGRVLLAITILQSAHSSNESAKALREAAEFYKVDVAAITAKVKEEFAAKEKAQTTRKGTDKTKPAQPRTAAKKAKAA